MSVDEALIPRRYGFPFSGYVSSRRKQLVDLHAITGDSRDVLVSPNEGQLRRRLGMSYVGETDIAAPAGMLETLWGTSGALRMARVNAPFTFYKSDGTTIPAAVVGSDGANTGAVYGTVLVYDPTDNNKYTFGEEFGSTHYPTSSDAGGSNFKMVPLPYLTPDQLPSPGPVTSTSVGYTRCANLFSRRFIGSGSWGVHSGPERTLLPSLYGTPLDWNNRYNKATGSGSEVLRARPWGHYPPLHAPVLNALQAASGTGDAQWQEGDTYYLSCMFQKDDGSFSKPFACRPVSSIVTAARGGLITLGTIGGVSRYRAVEYAQIPIGPPGTRARVLLRTAKVTLSGVSADPVLPDPAGPFYIVAVIENNTQTSYIDPAGNDTLLRRDDLAVRTDGIWPPSSRNLFPFERRLGVGFSRTNPCAIIISPLGRVGSHDLVASDTAASVYGQQAMLWRIVQSGGTTTLQLRRVDGASWPQAPTQTAITLTSTMTLQELVDRINATVVGSNGYQWCGQLAPGASADAVATQLQPTCIVVTGCATTINNPAITGDFTDIPIGACVSGAGIPANAAIGSKNGNGSASLINKTTGAALNATATANPVTLTFYADTGDDSIVNDSTLGNIRAYCPAYPAVIAFRGSYLDTLPIDRRSVYFTAAPPGQAASATHSFYNSQANRRGVPMAAGSFLAGAPIHKRAVLVYTGGVFVLDNQRGGTTGEDFDFHPYPGNISRGGIALCSVVAGNGWVGYMTLDGYIVADIVADQLRERLLTPDLFDPAQANISLRGSLASVIVQAQAVPQPDLQPFKDQTPICSAALERGALSLLYRQDVPTFGLDRTIYDFRSSIEGSGLQQVLRSVGADELSAQTYGWSAPQSQPCQHVIGPVYLGKSYGFVDYAPLANVPNPSTGEITMVELDAHIGRDDIFVQDIQSNLAATSNQLTATFTGGFRSVAIGARITNHANINAAATVIAKTDDGTTITMSHVSTNASPITGASLRFTGKEVDPVAYFAMDALEALRLKKTAHRATTLHRVQSGEQLYLGFARDRARASRVTMLLPNSGSEDNTREVVEIPIVKRTAGEVVEFSIEGRNASKGASLATGGYPAEFWGLDAELELVDSQT